MNKLLTLAGRHGPAILFVGVLFGLAAPALAEAAKPLMGVAVFVFTLGAFLKVDRPAFQAQLLRPARLALWLVWTVAGVPLATWALLHALPLAAGTRTGILLCMLAPPVGSAAAMAAMLRLNPALALTVTVAASLLSPFVLPPAAMLLGGVQVHLQLGVMTWRIGTVVGSAALVASAMRRFAGTFVVANPQAMTGISVLGLIVVAVGAMQGVRPQLAHHLDAVAAVLVVAFAVNAGFQVFGAALFARHGMADALTVGLMSGNRNVTLVWVAVAPWLSQMPGVELYLAAAVFPIFMLPLPLSKLLEAVRQRAVPARSPTVGADDGAEPATVLGMRARRGVDCEPAAAQAPTAATAQSSSATGSLAQRVITSYDDAPSAAERASTHERGYRLVARGAPRQRRSDVALVRGCLPRAEAHRAVQVAPR